MRKKITWKKNIIASHICFCFVFSGIRMVAAERQGEIFISVCEKFTIGQDIG